MSSCPQVNPGISAQIDGSTCCCLQEDFSETQNRRRNGVVAHTQSWWKTEAPSKACEEIHTLQRLSNTLVRLKFRTWQAECSASPKLSDHPLMTRTGTSVTSHRTLYLLVCSDLLGLPCKQNCTRSEEGHSLNNHAELYTQLC